MILTTKPFQYVKTQSLIIVYSLYVIWEQDISQVIPFNIECDTVFLLFSTHVYYVSSGSCQGKDEQF